MLFRSIETIANRIIEITPAGLMDRRMEFNEFLEDEALQGQIDAMYKK